MPMDQQNYAAHIRVRLEKIGFTVVVPDGDMRARLPVVMERAEEWGSLLLAVAPMGLEESGAREALVGAVGAWVRNRVARGGSRTYAVLVFPFGRSVPDEVSAGIKVLRRDDPQGRWGIIPWTADLEVELVDQHTGFPRLSHDVARALTEVPRGAVSETWRRVSGPQVGSRRSLKVDLGYVPATRFIMASTIAYYLWVVLIGGDFMRVLSGPNGRALTLWGANAGQLVLGGGQQWRLLTYILLHGGLIHLGLNMWALWNVGRHAEMIYGSGRMSFVYVVAGVAGGIASTVLRPGYAVSVGASGAILGLMGALVYFALALPGRRVDWRALLGPVGINLVFGFFLGGLVDNYAHVGGFVGGLLAAFLAGIPGQRATWRYVAMGLAGLAVLAVVAGLVPLPHLR